MKSDNKIQILNNENFENIIKIIITENQVDKSFYNFLVYELCSLVSYNLLNCKYIEFSMIKKIIANITKELYKYYTIIKDDVLLDPNTLYDEIKYNPLKDFGIPKKYLPFYLRKSQLINEIYLEISATICGSINEDILEIMNSEDAYDFSTEIFVSILEFFNSNCWEHCNNNCLIDRVSKLDNYNGATFSYKKTKCAKVINFPTEINK